MCNPRPIPLELSYFSLPKVAYNFPNFGIISDLIPVPVSMISNL